ncbi:PRP19 (YLL036C) [Zygosaccharomyces parabailii]|nr:PRP19 (YLL036C) [Zygosaccharomyces parabailii]CDH13608.1 uncharacterized protein ZBAI_05394 [Zygosaccharomyces bailii ISA1307]
MFCAISGKPPKSPVLSPSSKCIFEKELIEQYIKETGSDPINNAPLSADQLIVISQTPQQFALANAVNSSTLNSNYSIPNLLSTLQNEWDAIMLENFRLRKQLDSFTKQLSTALYERDAAKIVAANALKEREEVVQELNQLTLQIGAEEEGSLSGLPEYIIQRLQEESKEYVDATRKVKDTFQIPEAHKLKMKDIFDASHSPIPQKVTQLQGEIMKELVFTVENSQKVCICLGGSITQVELDVDGELDFATATPNQEYILFSTSNGQVGTFHVQHRQTSYVDCSTESIIFMRAHEHILKDYFLWTDKRGKIGYSSLDCSKTFLVAEGDEEEYLKADLHKDGLLLALGGADNIKVYNLSQFQEPPTVWQAGKDIKGDIPITGINFGSNGYWMIVSTTNNVMAFDLRKSVGTLALEPLMIDTQLQAWDMDLSGKNLAVCEANTLQFYGFIKSSKSWVLKEKEALASLKEELGEDTVKTVNISYDNSSVSLLIQTQDKILVYS